MDVALKIKSWRQERKASTVRFKEQSAILTSAAALLAQLPEELSYEGIRDGQISLTAYCTTDDAVRELIAQIRVVLDVKKSDKELELYSGTITYITQNDVIRTKVMGGAIPANCQLIPESHSYLSYTMTCKEE